MKNKLKPAIAYPPITSSTPVVPLDTSILFTEDYVGLGLSPIDQYYENNKSLNLICSSVTPSQEMASIILLGFMSAVESYLRAVFRGIISIDTYAQKLVENMDITYAAAIHHEGDRLPDALLEGISMASPDNIKSSLKQFLGIKGPLPRDVDIVLSEFSKVCELRHCCVHRFGRLGAKNAVKLGLTNHSKFLDKPINLTGSQVEGISASLRSLVNTINRFLFESLLDRMSKNKGDNGVPIYDISWQWNYTKDKKRFLKYYNLFATSKDVTLSPPAKEIYDKYRLIFNPI
jgi:hypothetical protein